MKIVRNSFSLKSSKTTCMGNRDKIPGLLDAHLSMTSSRYPDEANKINSISGRVNQIGELCQFYLIEKCI